ncbi:putative sporulation protein YlmC/YmxH family [Gottschalkia acidurici 9a]|uniref:Sporulation protein YlmC/YmxH family n=1 Tax=Gottschalkia acidurici (strain ATCC 7906 / DSM 604 / BCRC 14475 / CIP 104303 / KCTC 5404 / NCIMB 10678 / 9a) TaxID=1128398 RepID=K0B1J1_GOTA9|nr:YlmC/YmxH family sporulation protein [Gottschalkia acidurici]AFS78556.1 putative sporulation protein YlmC/YmxH family [Gottschalkia acidurici 9a]
MRLSELGGKEIVNLNDGGRLGVINDSDLVIDTKNGKILSLLVPDRNQFRLFGDKDEVEIPWDSIRKIGEDMMIIEFNKK